MCFFELVFLGFCFCFFLKEKVWSWGYEEVGESLGRGSSAHKAINKGKEINMSFVLAKQYIGLNTDWRFLLDGWVGGWRHSAA